MSWNIGFGKAVLGMPDMTEGYFGKEPESIEFRAKVEPLKGSTPKEFSGYDGEACYRYPGYIQWRDFYNKASDNFRSMWDEVENYAKDGSHRACYILHWKPRLEVLAKEADEYIEPVAMRMKWFSYWGLKAIEEHGELAALEAS